MRRTTWSRPIALALEHEIVRAGDTLLDYGCGHGDDVGQLQHLGYEAEGWDPAHRPTGQRRPSDVVNLGYVLNVIEDQRERAEVLRSAFGYARRTLVVAVRVDRSLKDAEAFGDGVITKRSTFQKLYTQAELREYVQQVLGVEPVMADLGIAYVFKDEQARSEHVANTTFGRRLSFNVDLRQRFLADAGARGLIERATALGRLPLDHEFDGWEDLASRFGGMARVGRLALAAVDKGTFLGSLQERANDIVVYLAKLRFAGARVPSFTALPRDIQLDIKTTWGSLKTATEEALVSLFSMGQQERVLDAMRKAPVGKYVGDALYVHSSAVDLLPPVLRLAEFAARKIVGSVEAEVIKFAEKGRAVSFLRYPTFDHDPHPGLRSSIRVHLPRSQYEIREYGDKNPFILHRKELFVAPDYPRRELFEALTRAEETAGLLDAMDIGTKEAWQETLAKRGYELDGHRLCRLGDAALDVRVLGVPKAPAYDPPMSSREAVDEFIAEIGQIKVHRTAAGVSLKKPALLLVVLARLGRGELADNKIRFRDVEPDLAELLRKLTGRAVSGLAEPFDRMKTSRFWILHLPEGATTESSKPLTKQILVHDECWAELRPELFRALVGSPDARKRVASEVVGRFLPTPAEQVFDLLGLR